MGEASFLLVLLSRNVLIMCSEIWFTLYVDTPLACS